MVYYACNKFDKKQYRGIKLWDKIVFGTSFAKDLENQGISYFLDETCNVIYVKRSNLNKVVDFLKAKVVKYELL